MHIFMGHERVCVCGGGGGWGWGVGGGTSHSSSAHLTTSVANRRSRFVVSLVRNYQARCLQSFHCHVRVQRYAVLSRTTPPSTVDRCVFSPFRSPACGKMDGYPGRGRHREHQVSLFCWPGGYSFDAMSSGKVLRMFVEPVYKTAQPRVLGFLGFTESH